MHIQTRIQTDTVPEKPHSNMEAFIEGLRHTEWYEGQIEHVECIPAREPRYGTLDKPLSTPLRKYIETSGLKLYTHQAAAINKILEGKNVIITTPTASGKTLAFNIPVFETLYLQPEARALYLYPRKALANDQLKTLRELERATGIKINSNIYDGDTPTYARAGIRKASRIILSNPYAIHKYLPWHSKWFNFYQNLKFILLDEAHVYRGVFGSNIAMLLRRLLRICAHYGSDPQFILASATIANPTEFAEKLTGKREFEVISTDGSARGKKYFIFWNPPLMEDGFRRSAHQETKQLFAHHICSGLQTLCFTISRRMAELLARWTREALAAQDIALEDKITAYRAGYLPGERREIEYKFKTRRLLGIASTNALELGIDIGSLDAVIISGYPGTVVSTWQQVGRAGRGTEDSIAALVAFENPLDQYFMKHPTRFFERPHEHAIIDLENPYISMGHVLCASAELPVTYGDTEYFCSLDTTLNALAEQNLVRSTPSGWVYSGTGSPVEMVTLDNISSEQVKVIHGGEVLETMELNKACEEAHEGAVLLHQGETYLVNSLDLKQMTAEVTQKDVDYYTQVLKETEISIRGEQQPSCKRIGDFCISLGEVDVTEHYLGYLVKRYEKVIGHHALKLPPVEFDSTALWFTVPRNIENKIKGKGLDFAGGLHALEHALIAMTPFYAMCDRWDIGGVSTEHHIDTGEATIFIYDAHQGGVGIAEKAYTLFSELLRSTRELIRDCACTDGCPSCAYSPKCGNRNEPMDKRAALCILDEIASNMAKGQSKENG